MTNLLTLIAELVWNLLQIATVPAVIAICALAVWIVVLRRGRKKP